MAENKLAYVVDFDGTITSTDLSCELAAYFCYDLYVEIEEKYRRREMPIRSWLEQVSALLPPDLKLLREKSLEWVKLRPGFERFLDHARNHDCEVVVASDGLGFYIEPVLKEYGLLERISYIYSNNILVDGPEKLKLIKPYAHRVCTVCGNCKASHVVCLKRKGIPVIYIGDGSNDRFGASWSDYIFARDKLAEACLEHDLSYSSWNDFYDIIAVEPCDLKEHNRKTLCLPDGRGSIEL